MPLRRRRVLVGLLLALLPALAVSAARPAASTARPAGEVSPNVVSVGNDFPLASGARLQANAWAGTWRTSDGATLNWVQTGDHVSGNWANNTSMQMEGTVTGNILQGTWTNSDLDSYPWAGGPFELTLSADGNSWSGSWSAWDWGGPPLAITATRVGGGGTDTTPPSSPPAETTAPRVNAFRYPGVAKPGTRKKPNFITLNWSVKDDSGHAKARVTLFEGGQYIRNAGYNGPATGRRLKWVVPLASKLEGPLFFCVWAKDAAGNKSAGAPRSDCGWISLLVPIEKVSNGCGGEGWDSVVAVENYFGNSSVYLDSYHSDDLLAGSYLVDFVAACNLHDAAYGGHTVVDTINNPGGPPIDFSTWTRKQIDDKFLADMGKLCEKKIPPDATIALSKCKANFRYDTVRTLGSLFFDADLFKPGTQDSPPPGSARSNE